jgi:hypothetical protein
MIRAFLAEKVAARSHNWERFSQIVALGLSTLDVCFASNGDGIADS